MSDVRLGRVSILAGCLGIAALLAILGLGGCNVGGSGDDPMVISLSNSYRPTVDDPDDARTDVLTTQEVESLIEAAARRHNLFDLAKFPEGPPRVAIAVTDRIGNILQVWNSDPTATASSFDSKIAVSLARTASYMSHSQAPLTSRTMQFLHTFHFPATFQQTAAPFSTRFDRVINSFEPVDACDGSNLDPDRFSDPNGPGFIDVDELYAPVHLTSGVKFTGQAPLWEINTTNRGGLNENYDVEDFDDANMNGQRDPGETFTDTNMNGQFDDQTIPRLNNPDGSLPNPGFTPLPGGIPLYKRTLKFNNQFLPLARRLVGAIGVYILKNEPGKTLNVRTPLADLAEEAAFAAARTGNPFRTKKVMLDPLDKNADSEINDPTSGLDDYTINGTIPVEAEGGVFLGGILLPYLGDTLAPLNGATSLDVNNTTEFPGAFDPAGFILADAMSGASQTIKGKPDPSLWLLSPRGSYRPDGLTKDEVETLILQQVRASELTHAAIRLPAISACQMIIAVSDFDGTLLGVYREPDATLFSLEVSISKARNAFYFSNPDSRDVGGPRDGRHPLTGLFDPLGEQVLTDQGIAVTARSLAFITQPAFPPVIDGSAPAPLRCLIDKNATAQAFSGMGFSPPEFFMDGSDMKRTIDQSVVDPNYIRDILTRSDGQVSTNQSGIVFFPGSAPLYKNGLLVGGIGVSGDGVEQDDYVTATGIIFAEQELAEQTPPITINFKPPAGSRCDQYNHKGIVIPYMKFPQQPNG